MNLDFWQKVITALAGAPGVVWLCKWLFERYAARDAARAAKIQQDREQKKEEDAQEVKERKERVRAKAELEKEEVRFLPETVRIYIEETRKLREELRTTEERLRTEFNATITRMEREAMRMMNFIGHLIETMNRMRNRLYLCDTVMHMHDKTWVSHDFVEAKIPPFKDPEPNT